MLEYEVGGFKYSFSVEKFPVESPMTGFASAFRPMLTEFIS